MYTSRYKRCTSARLLVWYGLLLFIVGSCAVSHAAPPESNVVRDSQAGIAQDSTAPNWILSTPQGNTLSLYQLAQQGKTTVMVFWSSWCKECEILLPALAQLMKTERSDSVAVVLLNVWENDDPERYLQKLNVDFPLLLRGETVARRYQISATPGVVIVDKERKVRYARPMREQVEDVIKRVTQLLPKGSDDEGTRSGGNSTEANPNKT